MLKKLLEKIEKEHLSEHELDEMRFKEVERLKVCLNLIQILQQNHNFKFSKALIDDLLKWKRGELIN